MEDERNISVELLEAWKLGLNDDEVCAFCDLTKEEYLKILDKNPELYHKKNIYAKTPSIRAKQNVIDSMNDGNVDTSKWYLERSKETRNEFSTKVVEETNITQTLTIEEKREEFAKALDVILNKNKNDD